MDKLKIEPKFKDLIPPLHPDEYKGLEELIIAEGIRDAIVTWNGVIVDGHNRYEIAEKHGITDYEIKERNFVDETEAMLWIIDNQLGRRNLTKLTRIELTKKMEPLIRAKSKEKQIRKPLNSVPLILAEQNYRENESRAQLAKLADVSQETFRRGEKILENAPPELIQEVREGNKKIHTAYREMQTGTAVCKECKAEKPASRFSGDRKGLCMDCENALRREMGRAGKEKSQEGEEVPQAEIPPETPESVITPAVEEPQTEESQKTEAESSNDDTPLVDSEPSIKAEQPVDEVLSTNEESPTEVETLPADPADMEQPPNGVVDELEDVTETNKPAEPDTPINPNYNIDAFQVEFRANAQSYVELAKRFITGHYAPLWNKNENKKIALAALDEVIMAIENLKGMV